LTGRIHHQGHPVFDLEAMPPQPVRSLRGCWVISRSSPHPQIAEDLGTPTPLIARNLRKAEALVGFHRVEAARHLEAVGLSLLIRTIARPFWRR